MKIPDDWKPTPENINALPEPLRKYIHALETDADPQGTIRENFMLKELTMNLMKECERLSREGRNGGQNDGRDKQEIKGSTETS